LTYEDYCYIDANNDFTLFTEDECEALGICGEWVDGACVEDGDWDEREVAGENIYKCDIYSLPVVSTAV